MSRIFVSSERLDKVSIILKKFWSCGLIWNLEFRNWNLFGICNLSFGISSSDSFSKSKVFYPIPLGGTLITLLRLIKSLGFISKRKYAKTSLISFRS